MLPRVLLVCLLDLIATRTAFGWNHVSRSKLESAISGKSLALVAFVAPWTEPSTALESEWVAATSEAQIPLLSIDCTSEADLCNEHEVISYPAIRVFNGHDKVKRYKGPRKAAAIVSFLKRATLPIVSSLDSTNITSFKEVDEAAIIAYLPEAEKTLREIFTELAHRYHDRYTFGIVSDKNLAKKDNVLMPSVVVHKWKEGEQEVLPGPSGVDTLETFLKSATAPTIGEFTRRNELKYMKDRKSLVYYFAHAPQDRESYSEALKPLAKNFKEYLNFVTVDAVEYGHMLPALGLQDTGAPALAVYNPIYGQTFPHDQKKKITPETVESFVMDIVQGRVQPLGAGPKEEEKHTEL